MAIWAINFINTYTQIITVTFYVKVLTKMYNKRENQKTVSETIKGKSSHLMIYAALKMGKKNNTTNKLLIKQ